MIKYKLLDNGYKIGDDGSIWSSWVRRGYKWVIGNNWKQLSSSVDGAGYLFVRIKNKNIRIHRLVLEFFVGPCPVNMEACHNDNNKLNNNLSNLRWDNHKNNCADRKNTNWLINQPRGEQKINSKLTNEQVKLIKNKLKNKESVTAIAKEMNIGRKTVCNIKHNKVWTHIQGE